MEQNNVGKEQMNKLPYIIAVDFDGTLVTDKFPDIGEPNVNLFAAIKLWQWKGYRVVLWTCRDGEQLYDAVNFCSDMGIEFDAVNKNVKEVRDMFNNDTRKVYANVYIDDKNISPSVPTSWPTSWNPKIHFKPYQQPVVNLDNFYRPWENNGS